MNYWSLLPRRLRQFLLGQPLPDTLLANIRDSLLHSESEFSHDSLRLAQKRSFRKLAALFVLVLSAYILYCILR